MGNDFDIYQRVVALTMETSAKGLECIIRGLFIKPLCTFSTEVL